MDKNDEAGKALARKNAQKIMHVLWDCMNQLDAVPVCLVVANLNDEISAITPDGLTGLVSLEKWMEIWPGRKPDGQMGGKTRHAVNGCAGGGGGADGEAQGPRLES